MWATLFDSCIINFIRISNTWECFQIEIFRFQEKLADRTVYVNNIFLSVNLLRATVDFKAK